MRCGIEEMSNAQWEDTLSAMFSRRLTSLADGNSQFRNYFVYANNIIFHFYELLCQPKMNSENR